MPESHLCWVSTAFLTNSEYPQREIPDNEIKDDVQCELKKVNCGQSSSFTVFNNIFFNDILNSSNKHFKILHNLNFIVRFVYNCKPDNEKHSGHMTGTEIEEAEQILVKFVQTSEFSKEFNTLKATGEVNANS
ncbi:hypothetical protein NPIL_458091 [Nephila pilipes]|uniref:Uncharacterized protein n=1 Tax=Nephila pilipes TaxID=299642 RepID=A0A8X6NKE2_NEPPI|nr:hypothetical protein NPIL_458091 [Nephila pilipes]